MSDKPVPRKGASKVANVIAKALGSVDDQGSIVTQCVTSANGCYRGADIPAVDLSFIVNNVARIRKWSAASIKARKSEVRAILKVYTELPAAMKRFRAKSDTLTWHQAVRLARCLARESTITKAVTAALANPSSGGGSQSPVERFASLVTQIQNLDTRSAKIIAFRKDFAKLLSKHGLS